MITLLLSSLRSLYLYALGTQAELLEMSQLSLYIACTKLGIACICRRKQKMNVIKLVQDGDGTR